MESKIKASMLPLLKTIFLIFVTVLGLAWSAWVYADDIAVDLKLVSKDEHVTVTVVNRSAHALSVRDLIINLNKKNYTLFREDQIPGLASRDYSIDIAMPELPGSYLISALLRYRNDQQLLSSQIAAIFYVVHRSNLQNICELKDTLIRENQSKLSFHGEGSHEWQLLLPQEIIVRQRLDDGAEHIAWLNKPITGLINRYKIYAGAEQVMNGEHQAALCSATLIMDGQFGAYKRGRLPDDALYFVIAGAGFSVFLIWVAMAYRGFQTIRITPLFCYLARLFWIALAYLLLRKAPVWIDALNDAALNTINQTGFEVLGDHFRGEAYRFFFEYFADAYFWGYLLLGAVYFLMNHAQGDFRQDKYCALLFSFFSLTRLALLKPPFWDAISRLGFLTLLVKLFFLPYMVSWSIQNVRHIIDLLQGEYTDIKHINDLFQTSFMLIDTALFAFGYIIESRRLGSEIKSVDPTFLGWLVCLWCYPPFNNFSFRYFDHPIVSIFIPTSPTFQVCITVLITCLWGVFSLASINLGFKASNLTNRGIVSHGLYRYVRHPAYVIKLIIWYIQGVFFEQYTLGILLAFTVVYVLRALTEEWHLNNDSDYIAYKKKTTWRFIPYLL